MNCWYSAVAFIIVGEPFQLNVDSVDHSPYSMRRSTEPILARQQQAIDHATRTERVTTGDQRHHDSFEPLVSSLSKGTPCVYQTPYDPFISTRVNFSTRGSLWPINI